MENILDRLSVTDLLCLHTKVLTRLKEEKVLRTENNPTGDYAEWLVAKRLGLSLEHNSAKGFDARDQNNARVQIKGRRITSNNSSRQLSVIRQLENQQFDYLIAVIFDENWQVVRAMRLPWSVIGKHAKKREHVNGHVLILRDQLLDDPLVEDITALLSES